MRRVTERARMAEAWNALAAEDAMFYIDTARPDWTVDAFLESGKELVEWAVEWAQPRRGRALDLGCGLGRHSRHLAAVFERVEALDISAEMIDRARTLRHPGNIHFALLSGNRYPVESNSIDFAMSFLVFQHIPDPADVGRNLNEIRRVLTDGGRAVLHFDTGDRSLLRSLALLLPDRLLPRTRRRFMRRYPLTEKQVRELCSVAGLTIVEERPLDPRGLFVLAE
jgi:ubiquinone/menaquinone biosynthesis C-methylase UbiE